ncbi:enoyl-CoA hydratase-related protein [Solirubrobacter ginsenosidimutans]|uniref:Enoyl-CoA hydratase-related protein n=1 Tax=Solirubrobacter ginsenosidimutans TaxID=490573 RepID=A0A9X3S6J6_9ACTN|nr:enoyl-CoA hydratase-related protein [Solirubrobacter ginsenosidimutans]MDA0166847.1 enoyl-CoA hydratase-related protein [Solirubrobacter ginsenosidimutans]
MTAITMTDLVLAERRGAVLVLTLNRPERLNAWTDALEERYYELLDAAEDDPDVRAIVVTGAGRGFCAGADLSDLERGATTDEAEAQLRDRPRPRSFPLTVRKPMIAAINGAAVGLGLVEALYCDLRFATAEAKLSTTFARRGLVAEYGISWLLPRLVGPSHALDLLLSGRVISGEEALRLGLVDRVSEHVVDDAVAYAAELAAHSSPWSMATIKAQVQDDLERPFTEAFAAAEELMLASFRRADVQEGVRSYLKRRAPEFPSLDPRTP